jgi:hypothetical protein
MSIEPIDPVNPPSVIDGPWWTSTIEPVARMELVQTIAPAERDPRAEALNIAQHGTAFISTPVLPSWQDLRRRRAR